MNKKTTKNKNNTQGNAQNNTQSNALNPPPHGGDVYEAILSGRPEPLDFSANISPLGLPEGVKRALAEHALDYERYPDPHSRELKTALAERHGLPQERIVCGAGSADLIFRIARALAPKDALVTAPTFSEYERAAAEAGAAVHHFPLSYPDFSVSEQTVLAVAKMITVLARHTGLVFLCNPNNPTGVLTPRETIRQILRACEANGAALVVDECFIDLVDEPEGFTAEPLLEKHENLMILKAFTKTWAMAGLRLGYVLCGSEKTATKIAGTGPPWSVSAPAQVAGIQALKEKDYFERLRALIKEEREKLKAGLSGAGMEVLGGSANYIFFRLPQASRGKNLAANLAEKGILIRDCSNFNELDDGTYFRVAVKLPEENERLISAIGKAVNHAD